MSKRPLSLASFTSIEHPAIRFISSYRPEIGSEILSVLAAAYIAFFLNDTFWEKATDYLVADRSALVALHVAILALVSVCTTLASAKFLVKPALIFLIGVSAAASWFTDSFGVVVDTDMVRNIFETTSMEAKDLLTTGFLRHLAFYFLLPSLLIVWVRVRHRAFLPKVFWNSMLSISCLLVFAGIGMVYYKPYSAAVRINRDLVKTLNPVTPLVSTVKFALGEGGEMAIVVRPLGTDAMVKAAANGSQKPKVAVVVVGETTRGANFSLGSYARQTNPMLARQDVIYFSNVTSCGTSTAISLPCMFSNLKRSGYSHDEGLANENVLDVFKRAGIDVTWLDNNTGSKGIADRVRYLNISSSSDPRFCQGGECRDGIFLEKVDEWLGNIKHDGVLVLHQIGNHGPSYYERYPDDFRRFVPDCQTPELARCKDNEIVNAYDNAILYTDAVLSQVIDRLKANSDRVSAGFLYISDHGESLGEGGLYLHGTPYVLAPAEQTRVPLIAWFDPGFAASISLDVSCLRKSAASSLSHDNFFSSLLGMMNVSSKVYERELDMFAPCRRSVGPHSSS